MTSLLAAGAAAAVLAVLLTPLAAAGAEPPSDARDRLSATLRLVKQIENPDNTGLVFGLTAMHKRARGANCLLRLLLYNTAGDTLDRFRLLATVHDPRGNKRGLVTTCES